LTAGDFIAPYLSEVDGLVFSIARHVPAWARDRRVAVIPPFLSPSSAKNADLTAEDRAAALVHCGLRPGAVRPWTVSTSEGPVTLRRPARVVGELSTPGEPLVVQVSRWDRLKDMDGVLAAFVSEVDSGRLALVGPDPDGIPDDIEQHAWFDRCLAGWRSLAPAARRRTGLICLPMTDLRENAVLVNAIQRAADVVVQKSLAEGFGLTVTEAMWKHRLVVGSAVGGIREQITHGEDGLLADDPTDLAAFGAVLASAVRGEVDGAALGARAHRRVLDAFLPDREIASTARLLAGSAP
ncbi:MAG TPA: glycosyltransferase, partial [Micromonosporaceae bacterium]|nr:glycosyltransferase [Micromonosporaceae bacterium]